jgi:putative ABC transport system permease protein
MIVDYISFAITSFRQRRVRSWLTMLGIFIGIASVVALISLGQGMQNAVSEQFEKVGSRRIIITAGGRFFGPMGSSLAVNQLTEDDIKVVRGVTGVEAANGILTKNSRITYSDETKYATAVGTPTDAESRRYIESIGFFEIEQGRQLKQGDSYKIVVGDTIAKDLFKKEISVGDKVEILDTRFEVVGVQKKAGTGIHDTMIRMPLETMRNLFDEPEVVSTIYATAKPDLKPSQVAENVKKDLRDHRNVDEGEEDFSVQTSEQLIQTFGTILLLVQVMLIGIAAISLIVGGIGIMNTMYTAVLERTREIGVMKAIGARNMDIAQIFLIESGLLGLAGGIIGTVIGMSLSLFVQVIAQNMGQVMIKVSPNPALLLGALMFSFIVGSLSGVLPAIQASRMNPVDALRKR